MNYSYTAVAFEVGVKGTIDAISRDEARRKLLYQNLIIVSFDFQAADKSQFGPDVSNRQYPSIRLGEILAQRESRHERGDLWNKFGTLLKGGVTILKALDQCVSAAKLAFNKEMFLKIRLGVNQGNSIQQSLFGVSEYEAAMVNCGEETGRLSEVLEILSRNDADLLMDDFEFVFSNLIGNMREAGIPLIDSLRALGKVFLGVNDKEHHDVCEELIRILEEGASLAEAMSQLPHYFTGSMISLVKSGELSGRLDFVLRTNRNYILDSYLRVGY